MPPAPRRKSVPAPIDRPLSKAYLREFRGWSNNWAPGVSDPTSLRTMENLLIERDGSVRVRPGLRMLMRDAALNYNLGDYGDIVGTHEVFYLADGSRAYLFAYRTALAVKFAVLTFHAGNALLKPVTLESVGFTVGAGLDFTLATTYVKYVQIDNKIFALSNAGESMRYFTVGATKTAKKLSSLTWPRWEHADKVIPKRPEKSWVDANASGDLDQIPAGVEYANFTALTLIRPRPDKKNYYYFGYYYTTYNEIGESAPSQVLQIGMARPWLAWSFETPNANNEPSGNVSGNPRLAADQLVLLLPPLVDTEARAQGALGWNLYMITWTDQDLVPTTGVKIGTRLLDGSVHSRYIQHTPAQDILQDNVPVPNAGLLTNYSIPSGAGQGLVAADRMILVNDPANPALIRWTSREQGFYTDFTASRGGGFKTLTSGNVFLTACVKLWQNPSSTDTLTILCDGADGHSTGYYMAPASVSSQSEQIQIMGFEETTATPGTVSPYGCEVVNNALYHPLDTELMKSTASNYNLNHKTITDQIARSWTRLQSKHQIVSAVLDNRIYYIVFNPDGVVPAAGNWGNEVWVLDIATETPTWSRWLIGGRSLRKVEIGGDVYMGIVTEHGLQYFDPKINYDETRSGAQPVISKIPWKLETNIQGANRAHDAWAHLQQVNPKFTGFGGQVRYGVRGRDVNGKTIDINKIFRQDIGVAVDSPPLEFEDQLLIRRDMKEWTFYAESVTGKDSFGGINLVQYRYLPATVNPEYENGSVETFEYRAYVAAP